MSPEALGLLQRLTEIAKGFFEAELGLEPRRISVLDEEGGGLIVIRVEGFMTAAEAALAQDHKNQEILDEYYSRVLERVAPMLRVAVEEDARLPLLACRTLPDPSRDECLYLLIVGRTAAEDRVSSPTSEGPE